MKYDSFILAVDGGGTKTDALVATLEGKILGRGSSGKINLHDNDITAEHVQRHFSAAVREAARKAHISSKAPFAKAVIGMAGIDSEKDVHVARKILLKAVPRLPKKFTLVNDTVIARRAGSDAPYGLGLIGGTGSNGYGINAKGDEAWVSGIGHYASDDGSAYSIGIDVLHAAAHSADGRGSLTSLERMVITHYGIRSMREIEWPLHHSGKANKSEISKLAPLADRAARRRDAVARAILHKASDALVLMGVTLVRRLTMQRTECTCVCVGGVFANNAIIWKAFVAGMKQNAPRVTCIQFKGRPVEGALKLACDS